MTEEWQEYYIDFDENGGEYTGHLRILTREKMSLHGDRVLKIGDTAIEIDETIMSIDRYDGSHGFVNVTDELRQPTQSDEVVER